MVCDTRLRMRSTEGAARSQGVPIDQWQYVTPTGAKVTMANAKALIFHFCAKLPSDRCAEASAVVPPVE